MWFLIDQTELSYSRSSSCDMSENTACGHVVSTCCEQNMDLMTACDLVGMSKHRSVRCPDAFQQVTKPISYHSHPCCMLCGPCTAMSAFQSSDLVVWLETCGMNVLFGLSSSYVCLTVKRDHNASTQLAVRLSTCRLVLYRYSTYWKTRLLRCRRARRCAQQSRLIEHTSCQRPFEES